MELPIEPDGDVLLMPKFEPYSVTLVPPDIGPLSVLRYDTTGASYVNEASCVPTRETMLIDEVCSMPLPAASSHATDETDVHVVVRHVEMPMRDDGV